MTLLSSEKLPYLLSGLLSLIGLTFTNLSNQIFYNNDDIIEYSFRKDNEEFDSSKKVWFTSYQYKIKNISKHIIDTTKINFELEPDTLTQKNVIIDHLLKPLATASIKDVSTEKILRLSLVQIWNYLPDAEYQYNLKVESISKDILPQISIRANRVSFTGREGAIRLVEKNTRTWLINNKLLLYIVWLSLLILSCFIYIARLNRKN